MNHKYFQLPRYVFQNIFLLNHKETLDIHLVRRWAGHSKWQNVKADKERSAKFKSMQFSKIGKDISKAVQESGDDPKTNSKLRNLIEISKKVSMPNSSLQKAINRGKSTSGGKPYWVGCKGPFNLHVSFEITYPQQANFQAECGSKLKKMGLKIEKNVNEICTERGIIVCKPLNNVGSSLDQALEHGIEIGANDVFEMKDQMIIFECSPDRVDSIESQLKKKGYDVHSSGTEVEFHETIKLENDELQKINSLLDKIVESHDDVQRFSHNVDITNKL